MVPPLPEPLGRTGIARRAGSLFVAGGALVALVAGLLVANYRAARTLRENVLTQHVQWVELKAMALGNLLGGAEEDLRTLAESREVAAFFESRDLGMSPQYGLDLTLVPIRQRLLDLCRRGRAGAPPAFHRIALLDEAGHALADSEGPGGPPWPGQLDRAPGDRGARLSSDARELLIGRAHWWKGRYVGHLVAWLHAPSTIATAWTSASTGEKGLLLLVDQAGRAYAPGEEGPPGAPAGLAALAPEGRVVELERRWLGARAPVPGQPLSLVHAVRAEALFGALSPAASLATLAAAAAAVLLLVLVAAHWSMRSFLLEVRLDESLLREREVAEKHAALERAQAELRGSEERFRGIFDTVPEGIALLRASDQTILDVNPGFERTFGWKREEVLQQPLPNTGLPRLAGELVERLRREGELRGVELRASRRDGAAVDVQVSARTAELAGERVVVAAARDVTEEKRLAEAVRHSQRMDAMGDLAAGIAHNFSNALAAILPNLQWCLDEVLTEARPPEACALDGARHALEDALQAAKSAADLARQLTLVARRERDVRRERVDAVTVLDTVLRVCRSTFDRQIRIGRAIKPAHAIVLAPPGHLHHMLLNLCINARDALSGRPAPELSVEALEGEGPVPGTPGPSSHHLVVRVADNGCGMSPATLARLGEPFFTTKGPGLGTGLGLATAYGIVRDLGGRITCTSQVGEGSTFTLELPLVAVGAGAEPASRGGLTLAGRKVLVVDDEPLVRAAMFRQLRALGAEVAGAGDGHEGLSRVRAERFDVVLLDLSMPGMPGTEVLAELRGDPASPPVIVVSGNVPTSGLAGAAAVLEKPVEVSELTRTIARVLAPAVT